MARSKVRGKPERVQRAQERTEVATKRTPQEQLKRLDEKFGEGKGAVKERAKLARRIAAASKEGKKDEVHQG